MEKRSRRTAWRNEIALVLGRAQPVKKPYRECPNNEQTCETYKVRGARGRQLFRITALTTTDTAVIWRELRHVNSWDSGHKASYLIGKNTYTSEFLSGEYHKN